MNFDWTSIADFKKPASKVAGNSSTRVLSFNSVP